MAFTFFLPPLNMKTNTCAWVLYNCKQTAEIDYKQNRDQLMLAFLNTVDQMKTLKHDLRIVHILSYLFTIPTPILLQAEATCHIIQ